MTPDEMGAVPAACGMPANVSAPLVDTGGVGLGEKVAAANIPRPQAMEYCDRQTPRRPSIPPLPPEAREALYERLRNNVPELMQKEHRWILIYDTGEHCKMPIGGHPSATMNLEEAIAEHRRTNNNIDAIGYTTGGQMRREPYRTIPPDPRTLILDYDDLKDADGNTIATPEIIGEIEKLRKFGAYVEISGSGKGMHVCIPKPDYYDAECKGVIRKSHQPEIFGHGQYTKITAYLYGDALPDWQAFAESEEAAKLLRDIITREGGFRTQAEKEFIKRNPEASRYAPMNMDTLDWPDKVHAVENVNNYAERHWPIKKIMDPSNTAYGLCCHIAEYLKKHDLEHYTPEHINAVFMECKRFSAMYGEKGMHRKKYPDDASGGWHELKATLTVTNAMRNIEEREQDADEKKKADQAEIKATNTAIEAARDEVIQELKTEFGGMQSEFTLEDYARGIAKHNASYILDAGLTERGKVYVTFDGRLFRDAWHWVTHATALKESKSGFVWNNGRTWNVDEQGRAIQGAIDQCIDLVCRERADDMAPQMNLCGASGYEVIRSAMHKNTAPRDIAAFRTGPAAVSTVAVYEHGLTCKDGVIIIDAEGIHITQHDPEKDVWFGRVEASTTDLLENLTTMTFDEVVNKFPLFKESLEMCGNDKVRLIASMAGVAIYYMMPKHIPLDVWYYLWDAANGGTGKTTHMKRFRGFFREYMAMGINWEIFTGENEQNGSFLGKIGVECEEASVSDIKDAEKLKARTSGGWTLKILYQNPTKIDQALLLISLGNVKPLLSRVANTRPIWERIQPSEFKVKLRNTGIAFPCPDDEYYRALLNIGCWVAFNLMEKGTAVSKQDLPYYVPPEEVKALCTRVPWMEMMPDIGEWEAGAKSPLKTVLATLKHYLKTQGWTDDDLKGAPELRNESTFRIAVNEMSMRKRTDTEYSAKGYLKVVEVAAGEMKKESRYWIKNYKLTADAPEAADDTPPPTITHKTDDNATETRDVHGQYYVNHRTGAIVTIKSNIEDTRSWDVTRFIQQKDPVPALTGKILGEITIKDAVFRLQGNTLISITLTHGLNHTTM